jgi:hypothetical protein
LGQIIDHIRSRVLGRAKVGSSKRRSEGLLEGAHLSMSHGRSQEYDDLRQYVQGDDVRDIDWKASARSGGELLVKRYIAQRQHRVQLVADVGREVLGRTPSGELKKDVVLNAIGVAGLSSVEQGDEIGLTYGDSRVANLVTRRRGENHLEMLLKTVFDHKSEKGGPSNLVTQLRQIRHHNKQRLVVFMVSDEPELDDELLAELKLVATKHKMFWLIVQDEPLLPALNGQEGAVDVATGALLLPWSAIPKRIFEQFEQEEQRRRADFEAKIQTAPVTWARIDGTADIVPELTAMIRRSNHHGACDGVRRPSGVGGQHQARREAHGVFDVVARVRGRPRPPRRGVVGRRHRVDAAGGHAAQDPCAAGHHQESAAPPFHGRGRQGGAGFRLGTAHPARGAPPARQDVAHLFALPNRAVDPGHGVG